MATSATLIPPIALADITTDDNAFRLDINALLSGHGTTSAVKSRAGVRPSGGSPLAGTWTSGMDFTVNAGLCVLQGTDNGTQGTYLTGLETQQTFTAPTADATNDRIDLVAAAIVDNGDNTSTYSCYIVEGTPDPSPTIPDVPANGIPLFQYTVGAGVSALSGGVFQDLRTFTVAAGGILPVASSGSYPSAGPTGSYLHNLATDQLMWWDGSNVVPLKNCYTCTSSTHPSNPKTGTVIFETDTKLPKLWDGSAWRIIPMDSTGSTSWTPTSSGITLPSGSWSGSYRKSGNRVYVDAAYTMTGSMAVGNMIDFSISLPFTALAFGVGSGQINWGNHPIACDVSGGSMYCGFVSTPGSSAPSGSKILLHAQYDYA